MKFDNWERMFGMKFHSKTLTKSLCAAFLAAAALPAASAEARPYAEVIMNADTREVLQKKTSCSQRYADGECIVYPASMTKMVSAAVVLNEVEKGNISLDDTVRVSSYAASIGGSGIGNIRVGYSLSLHEALGLMAKKSDNKITRAVAEHAGGSVRNFVRMMNDYVQELGIENTNFVNPTGWPDSRQRTSAEEMARLYSIMAENETLSDYFDGRTMVHNNRIYRPTSLVCYNRLEPIALKTGWTNMSGATIGFVYEADDGFKYTIALFGFPSAYERNRRLMEILDEIEPEAAAERARLGRGHCPRNGAPAPR